MNEVAKSVGWICIHLKRESFDRGLDNSLYI